ncbi:MAG: thymidine phosphorylase, partial [Elusimicrobia bacterium]|nr:thymidine phosphorylase [Elusimicrobiota bacterium]
GGTLDKLESIPGFRTNLTQAEFLSQMERIGVAMIGQTSEIAPADKKIYALRDVTATVDSIPLIAASILSKKLAEGCDALVLDVKTGCGAFMREKKDAVRLAQVMADICKRSRKKVAALVTRMEEPLGNAIGNGLEVWQAIEILRGEEKRGTESFIELTDVLGGWMLFFGGKVRNSKEGRAKISEVRKSGAGLKKFEEIVRSQGGDPEVIADPKKFFFRAPIVKEVTSPWKGSVSFINARSVGVAALLLGAGRENQDSVLDPSAGILLAKKLGDRVERGEPIAQFFYSPGARFDEAEKVFLAGVKVGKLRPQPHPLIHQVIR